PHSFASFADLREYLTLVTGVNHEGSSPGHIPARGIALSASHDTTINTDANQPGTYRGQNHPEPSIDQIVADAWAGQTPFSLAAIGICAKGPYQGNSSWKAGGAAFNHHQLSPSQLWSDLFSGGVEPEDYRVLGASRLLGKSMLDAVMADATALQSKLGATDRQRMEQHLDGLRAIEHRLADWTSICTPPDPPADVDYQDYSDNEQKQAKAEVMTDLLAAALACDLTRVFSFEWSATQSEAMYWEQGITTDHHNYNHNDGFGVGMQNITQFIMSNLAMLATKLKALPELDGNLLDRTLVLGTSEHAVAGNHDWVDHPFVLVGRAGGAIKAGMHYRHPDPGNLDGPKVLLTAVRAVGVDLAELGQPGGENGVAHRRVSETIGELES
ncbi:MAG TPA: DUF1552 domain-containing protein, partial [Nannocystaceae bacterium]|nr:DUF1552 domain-containing protein [Nannocystaceae bacterium]